MLLILFFGRWMELPVLSSLEVPPPTHDLYSPGRWMEFDAPTNDSLTIYLFLEDECLISQFYTNELSRLYDKYKGQHIGFVGYFPSPATGPEEIKAFAEKFKLAFPLLPDPDKTWTRKMGATVTPEAAAWDHRTDQLIYRGRIDDSYVRVGKRNLHPKNHDLEDIISAWRLNQTPDNLVETQAIGCFITFETARE